MSCSFREGEGRVVFFFGHVGDGRSCFSGADQRRVPATKWKWQKRRFGLGDARGPSRTKMFLLVTMPRKCFCVGGGITVWALLGSVAAVAPNSPESIKTATKCKHLHAHLPLNSESDQISQPFIFTLMTTFTNSFQRAEYAQTRSSDLTVVVIYFIRLFYVSN